MSYDTKVIKIDRKASAQHELKTKVNREKRID